MAKWKHMAEDDGDLESGTDSDSTPSARQQPPERSRGVTISISPKSIRLLLLLGALGVTAYFTVPFLIEHVPLPMLHCERLDRRCQRAMQSGSNLSGAMVCGMTGFLTLGGRTQEQCRKANEVLDGLTTGEDPAEAQERRDAEKREEARRLAERYADGNPLPKLVALAGADAVHVCDPAVSAAVHEKLAVQTAKLSVCLNLSGPTDGTKTLSFTITRRGTTSRVRLEPPAKQVVACMRKVLDQVSFEPRAADCPVRVRLATK